MAAVTAQVPGAGTTSLSYTIPGDGLDVETVYATIDTTGAASAVTATLTITDQSGVVIAKKVQTTTIATGAAAGSATWGLRLDDDVSGGGGGISYGVQNTGTFLLIAQTDAGGFMHLDNQGTNGNLWIELSDATSVGGSLKLATASVNVPISLEATGQINMSGNGGGWTFTDDLLIRVTGANDLVLDSAQDVNLTPVRDVNLTPQHDLYLSSGTFGGGGNIIADLPAVVPAVSGALYVAAGNVVKQVP